MTLEEWHIGDEVLKAAGGRGYMILPAARKLAKEWGCRPPFLRDLAKEVKRRRALAVYELGRRMRQNWPDVILDVDGSGGLIETWRGRDGVERTNRTEAMLS